MKKIAVFIIIIFSLSYSTVFAEQIEQTPSGIPMDDLEEFIDQYVENYIDVTTPGAAILVIMDGEVVFSKGYGTGNIEEQIPVDAANTVFEYGSISKLFVYTTIMRLSEEGKIDLNEDIREYLPEGFLKKVRFEEPITMLNVMSHTTGFEDYLFDVILTKSEELPTLEDTLLTSQPEQVYRPGTISAYSNYAVSLAAYIAEQMIGQEFYEYLTETIFKPLRMNSTSAHQTLSDNSSIINSKAMGYFPKGNGTFKPGGWSYLPLYPAGSVNGTAEDLARFAIALMPEEAQNSPLFKNRATLDEMLTQTHSMGPGLTGFAHGFIEWDGKYRGVGHGGNTAAFSSQVNIIPEERFGVIVLTNAAGELDISSGLTSALFGEAEKKDVPDYKDPLPSEEEVTGTYISARRMHNGFLELYNFLSLLKVEAIGSDRIELSMGGQRAEYIQTGPYFYERLEAEGSIFENHFEKLYFETSDGKVLRMSGDYTPLPSGRTKPWLILSLVVAIIGALYFLAAPIVVLIGKLRKKGEKTFCANGDGPLGRNHTLLMLCGTGLLINNAFLIARMLMNNYRSFGEIKIHILLNYPLIILAAVFGILTSLNLRAGNNSKWFKVFSLATLIIIVAFCGLLIDWQFLKILA